MKRNKRRKGGRHPSKFDQISYAMRDRNGYRTYILNATKQMMFMKWLQQLKEKGMNLVNGKEKV